MVRELVNLAEWDVYNCINGMCINEKVQYNSHSYGSKNQCTTHRLAGSLA